MANIQGIRERFGKGLSTEEKLKDSKERAESLRKNLSLALGGKEINEKVTTLMTEYVQETAFVAHFAEKVAEAERERKAREAAAKVENERAEMLAKGLPLIVARIGTGDPSKVAAALAEMVGGHPAQK